MIAGSYAPNRVDDWFYTPKPNPRAATKLFCFPHAGAGTAGFQGWVEKLGPRIELSAVRLPGREQRLGEPLVRRLAPLRFEIAEALLAELDRPYALFGHSLGAVLAFEVARDLDRRFQLGPEHLFVSGSPAPQSMNRREMKARSELSDRKLVKQLVRMNGLPKHAAKQADFLKFVLPAIRADSEVDEQYVYEPGTQLSCPITCFGGVGDPETNFEGLESWDRETSGPFAVRMFPGDHFFVRSEESRVVETIRDGLLGAS